MTGITDMPAPGLAHGGIIYKLPLYKLNNHLYLPATYSGLALLRYSVGLTPTRFLNTREK
jgi:hypothetical protein